MSELNFHEKGSNQDPANLLQKKKQKLIAEIRKADPFYNSMNLDYFSLNELSVILERLKSRS